MPKWTDEQKKVIELHNRNILVSAAAGSGKTAVLVQRIIEMISDEKQGIDIDKLLIVTYTNAAAYEMKERILRAVEERMQAEPENMHLRRQQSLINHAQITTIDSFCLNVIRNYFSQIDIDPGFTVVDEAEEKLMFSDIIDEMIEEYYQQGREDFLDFVECFTSEKSDICLEEYILNLYRAAMSNPNPQEWLDKAKCAYKAKDVTEFLELDIMKNVEEFLKNNLDSALAIVRQAQHDSMQPGGPKLYMEALNDDESFINRIKEIKNPFECAKCIKEHKYSILSRKKDSSVDIEAREKVKNMRDVAKEAINDAAKLCGTKSLEEAFELACKCAPLMDVYVELTKNFIERIGSYKRKRNVIDFVDMEHLALKILVRYENGEFVSTGAATELADRFEEILIDEYQDSNMIQETILKSISKEKMGKPNIFMVGDVKQSIYRFRLARPQLFIEKYDKYTDEDSQYQKIELHNNFRSRKEVLSSVNSVFARIMKKEFGDIEYDDNAKLYPKADFLPVEEAGCIQNDSDDLDVQGAVDGGSFKDAGNDFEFSYKSEVLVISHDSESDDGAVETEAKICADKIKKIVNNPGCLCFDNRLGKYRRIKYKDIVILMRGVVKNADIFVNVFADFGIPAVTDSGKGYFDSYEVAVVLNLLNVIDNPRQDIALSAVLKSYFGMFSSNELAIIKAASPKKSLFDALFLYSTQNASKSENADRRAINEAILGKKEKFLEFLDYYRNMSRYETIHQLIWNVVYNTGYYAYISGMPFGPQRCANLDMLTEKAKKYENTSFHGLFNFVRYIQRLKSYDVDYPKAALNGENDDAVRIMTIHKSKGLEFPVVFLCNANKQFNKADIRNRIILDADLGIGTDFCDTKQRLTSHTIIKKAIEQKIKMDNLSEEQRILYVAMTRAREKLYVTGTISSKSKNMDKWCALGQRNQLTYADIAGASNYFDMIMPAAMQDDSEFIVNNIKPEAVAAIGEGMVHDNIKKKEDIQTADGKIEGSIEYSYPYRIVEHPMKMTVSQLKHLKQDYDEEYSSRLDFEDDFENGAKVPEFVSQKEEVAASARGSAYHKVMELLDYEKCTDEDKVSSFVEKCVCDKKITRKMADSVKVSDIFRFITSDIGNEIKKAFASGRLFRERQFVMGVSADEADQSYETDDMILIQGIIDAYYETDEGLVLVDYKTDNAPFGNDGEKELIKKYQKQLEYYELALTRLTGKKVIKKSIYSFKLGKEIVL